MNAILNHLQRWTIPNVTGCIHYSVFDYINGLFLCHIIIVVGSMPPHSSGIFHSRRCSPLFRVTPFPIPTTFMNKTPLNIDTWPMDAITLGTDCTFPNGSNCISPNDKWSRRYLRWFYGTCPSATLFMWWEFRSTEIPNITLEWNAMTCFHPPEKKNVFKFHSRNFYIHHSVDRLISITQRRPSFNLYAWPTPFDVATRREKHAKIQRIPSDSVGRIATQPQNFQHPFPHHSLTWLEFVYPALFVYQTCW